jgi:hypothetical protein
MAGLETATRILSEAEGSMHCLDECTDPSRQSMPAQVTRVGTGDKARLEP